MRAFCDICSELFDEKKDVAATICGHIFHETCIKTWMNNSHSCPKCRNPVENIIKLFFSISPSEGLSKEYLENEVNNLKTAIQVKDLEIIKRKVEDDKLASNLAEISLSVLRLQEGIENSQTKYLKAITSAMNWCLSLKGTIYRLLNLTAIVQSSWEKNTTHQKYFEIKIQKLQQEFETCKQMLLQQVNNSEDIKRLNVENIDDMPIELPISHVSYHPGEKRNQRWEKVCVPLTSENTNFMEWHDPIEAVPGTHNMDGDDIPVELPVTHLLYHPDQKHNKTWENGSVTFSFENRSSPINIEKDWNNPIKEVSGDYVGTEGDMNLELPVYHFNYLDKNCGERWENDSISFPFENKNNIIVDETTPNNPLRTVSGAYVGEADDFPFELPLSHFQYHIDEKCEKRCKNENVSVPSMSRNAIIKNEKKEYNPIKPLFEGRIRVDMNFN